MSIPVVLSLIAGLVLLVAGAEGFVRGAAKLAAVIGLSPLVIGLTVVSYGTSAPELAVSLQASFQGQAEIALGNVIGSNIFNILMTLGIAAIVVPLTVAQQIIRLDVPIMIGVTVLMLMFAVDGELGRFDGVILLVGSVVYTAFLVYQSRKESDVAVQAEYEQEYAGTAQRNWQQALKNVLMLVVGLIVLVVGANLLVFGATAIAESFGVSQLIIGLTIVAIGTSLPELATSLVACYRGERDIAVGNVVGSNIFNILTILGVTATFHGVPVSNAAISFDIPVMLAVAIASLPIFYTGNRISRWEGLLFVSYYVAYTAYLGLNAVGHEKLGLFSNVMLLFVIPLTVITLFTIVLRRPNGLTTAKEAQAARQQAQVESKSHPND
ncbi:calcium/sodium antiporter [Leptolyngbya iicbica]|uniref:Calcium/sodium antiporter n=2 Tax=Cyanophyceae TaxID=3028117 RepID=A0A4Q7EIW3_9CYAN|nr:calcium/sodium antiporter [Leptolyngbya sp. LK]RZM81729.1 calcium/sodium antiporter [Leptolyngbya sp. LK]